MSIFGYQLARRTPNILVNGNSVLVTWDEQGRPYFECGRLSLPQIKFERIDGVILRGAAWQLCCQQLGLLAEPVHPCSAPSGCELRCNISDTIRAGGEDAARQTQLHSPSNPA